MSEVVRVETDATLEAYAGVWNAVTPADATSASHLAERLAREPRRLHLLALEGGEPAGCGLAIPSASPDRGFVAVRVLPGARRRGVGSALLRELAAHVEALGLAFASGHVDGPDPAASAFAARYGFEETGRQVEQVRALADEPQAGPPPGVLFVSVADRPELLREAYPLAVEGYADMATASPVTISLEDWLAEEATLPGGSLAALADGELVGWTGLCRLPDGTVEDGLTVVRRDWRRRGLALALKRAKLGWAARAGIAEITTWTQEGNGGMRAVNERLGYADRRVTVDVRAPVGEVLARLGRGEPS